MARNDGASMAGGEPVEGDVVLPYAGPRPHQPFWVKVGLWGLSGRTSAWVFFWGCVIVAGFCTVRGFSHPRWFLGTSLLLSAFWYWAAIRWVDRHGGWSQVRE